MASDYGDDAGEKMIEDFMRFGERMGERAMYDRAKRMEAAFEKARDAARSTPAEGGIREEPSEWAKLDMAKFREIEGYEGVKDIISTKLRSRSVDSAWFEDPESGKEYLLFRISDVEEVCQSFDELSKEAGEACDRAAAGLAKLRAREAATGGDERPLAERAENARKASKALEAEGATTRAATRGPRIQEVQAR